MRYLALMLAMLMALPGISSPVAAQSEAREIIEVVGLQAHPSDVDRGNPILWPTINVDPYQGNVTEASAILSPKTDIRPLERAEAWQMRARGECFVYQLQPGDVTRTTFGEDRTMLAEVGFTGLADVCIIRGDGTAVVFPRDCANIGDALAIVRRAAPPPPVVEYVPPAPVGVTITTTMTTAETSSNQGIVFGGIIAPRYAGGNTIINNGASSSATATVVANQATVVGPACPGSCPSSIPNE